MGASASIWCILAWRILPKRTMDAGFRCCNSAEYIPLGPGDLNGIKVSIANFTAPFNVKREQFLTHHWSLIIRHLLSSMWKVSVRQELPSFSFRGGLRAIWSLLYTGYEFRRSQYLLEFWDLMDHLNVVTKTSPWLSFSPSKAPFILRSAWFLFALVQIAVPPGRFP